MSIQVYIDGQYYPKEEARVSVFDHGLLYGDGIFEGIRAYNSPDGPMIFRLDDHLERFFDSAKVYQFKMPYTLAEMKQAIVELVRENQFKDCYIRPIAFVGYGRLGVYPNRENIDVHIGSWPWGAYLGDGALENGVRVSVTSWKKFQSQMFPVMAKATGQYLNSMLAVMDAKDRGYDEALLLNENGDIAEGSGENIFLVKNGVLYTNPINASILAGITRDSIIQIASDMGIEVNIQAMTVGQMILADEAFFTGTAVEVTPIRMIDNRSIGNGDWPIMRKLQEAYFDIVKGKDSKYRKWLTPVYTD